nr:MAG TPA: hypothetical protein [Caudoviricetes sp.]
MRIYSILFTRPFFDYFIDFRWCIAIICRLFRLEFFDKFLVCLVLHVSSFLFNM